MLDDFLVRAALAGLGVALVAAPLGCFVMWRRMAYFGDTMAHAALLGVALGFGAGIALPLGVLLVCLVVAALLVLLERVKVIPSDALLGILSHASLSVGLVALGFMTWIRVDLMGYLFGDVLAVSRSDVGAVWAGGVVVLAVLVLIWRPLLAATVDPDLARAEGVAVDRARILFMGLIALTIAVAMKIVGILLITSLLIIPAAAARRFARTPEGMAVIAAGIGAAAVCGGLVLSVMADTPSGPSIVVAALGLFLLGLVLPAPRTA